MHCNPIHTLESLTQRAHELVTKRNELRVRRAVLLEQEVALKNELQAQEETVTRLTKVLQLYRVLTDAMVLDQVASLESLVTEGLRAIFSDQNLEFKAEVGESRNKVSVDFSLIERNSQGDEVVKGDLLESFGGGPASIVSLLLRVFTLLRMKRYPVLLLDETLSAVADAYVEATGVLLSKLAKASNMPILLVSHNPAFLEAADHAYKGETSSDQLQLLKV